MNISEAISDYLLNISTIDRKAPRTIKAYRSNLAVYEDHLKKLGITSMEDIDKNAVQDFVSEYSSTHSPTATNQMIACVKGLHHLTSLNHEAIPNPTQIIHNSKVPKKTRDYCTEEEIRAILDSFDKSDKGEFDKTVFMTLYACGLRESELIELLSKNVHLENNQMKILGKGGKERIVPIAEPCVAQMKLYQELIRKDWDVANRPEFFINKKGNPLNAKYIYRLVKTKSKEIGLDANISPHSIRHSFATHLLKGGTDLRYLQEMLGHEEISTTEVYTHINREEIRERYDEVFGNYFVGVGCRSEEDKKK